MKFFLWFIVIAAGLSVIGTLSWLYTGRYPERTPYTTAFNAVCDTILCVWAIALLVGV